MALEVTTKDCTALGDAELAELAELTAECAARFEVGELSKHAEEWVLVTQVREDGKLRGFTFSTLERIGGTPCVLLGMGAVKRMAKRDSILKGLIADNFRRALMAFPDEDVLIGTKIWNAGGFEALKALTDVNPRPDHKPSGEERAWGRRLAKRFKIDAGNYDDKSFRVAGDGSTPALLDHESAKPEKQDPEVVAYFDGVNVEQGDCLVAFGWVMAEELLKHG